MDGIRKANPWERSSAIVLERALQELAPKDPGLFDLIDKLRSIAPMNNGSQLDVVDGLGMIRQIPDPKTYTTTGWAAALSAPLRAALASALTTVCGCP